MMKSERYRQYCKIELKYKLTLKTATDIFGNLEHLDLIGRLLSKANNKVTTISLFRRNK